MDMTGQPTFWTTEVGAVVVQLHLDGPQGYSLRIQHRDVDTTVWSTPAEVYSGLSRQEVLDVASSSLWELLERGVWS